MAISPMYQAPPAPAPLPPPEPMVSAAVLSRVEKRQLWAFLRQQRPERAAFFEDPLVATLLGQGADPLFSLEEIRAAGLEIERARWS